MTETFQYINIPPHPVQCMECSWKGTADYLTVHYNPEEECYDCRCPQCGYTMLKALPKKAE